MGRKENAKSNKKTFSIFDLSLVPGSFLGKVCIPYTLSYCDRILLHR